MNTLGFTEIKQSRQPGCKESPRHPFSVRKTTQLVLPSPHHQISLAEFELQAVGLHQQKNTEQAQYKGWQGPQG